MERCWRRGRKAAASILAEGWFSTSISHQMKYRCSRPQVFELNQTIWRSSYVTHATSFGGYRCVLSAFGSAAVWVCTTFGVQKLHQQILDDR